VSWPAAALKVYDTDGMARSAGKNFLSDCFMEDTSRSLSTVDTRVTLDGNHCRRIDRFVPEPYLQDAFIRHGRDRGKRHDDHIHRAR